MDLLKKWTYSKILIIFFQVPSSLPTSMTSGIWWWYGWARHESFVCKFSEQNLQNNMTILSNIPISDHLIRVQTTVISDRQERTRGIQTVNSSYTWLKSCFQWSVDLCRTMVTKKDMTLLWWLVVVIIDHYQIWVIEVPSCSKLLSTGWICSVLYIVHC